MFMDLDVHRRALDTEEASPIEVGTPSQPLMNGLARPKKLIRNVEAHMKLVRPTNAVAQTTYSPQRTPSQNSVSDLDTMHPRDRSSPPRLESTSSLSAHQAVHRPYTQGESPALLQLLGVFNAVFL